jgi:hypothetical protein
MDKKFRNIGAEINIQKTEDASMKGNGRNIYI